MYTIKQASRVTGVSEASLRAWERRYGVVVPHRSESGYRLYDEQDLAAVSTMRRLVSDGWSPAEAADAVRSGTAPAVLDEVIGPEPSDGLHQPHAVSLPAAVLSSAAQLDTAGIEESLDGGFALGSFEHVVDSWLFSALEALGEGWARGEIDVAGEHAASHAVHRRLSAAFDAAGSRLQRGRAVVVGLPLGQPARPRCPGVRHRCPPTGNGRSLPRRQRAGEQLGDGRARPSGQRGGPVRCHPPTRPAAIEVAERLLARPRSRSCVPVGHPRRPCRWSRARCAPRIGAAAQQLDQLAHGTEH